MRSSKARIGTTESLGNFGGTLWPLTPTRKRMHG